MASPELLVADAELSTRERIRRFNLAFGRPVNTLPVLPSVSDRILLGKLLLEEVIETLTLGLGLTIGIEQSSKVEIEGDVSRYLTVTHTEGDLYDPVETADGMGDVNVVNHFMAHWLGFNLDKITAHIDDSNMSKLDIDGDAIINGITIGYRDAEEVEKVEGGSWWRDREDGFDPDKPIGKILKSDQFWDAKPGIPAILAEGNN